MSGLPANASLALMPALHARLLALTDQCVSHCTQVTQLPASSAYSSQALTYTERTDERETTGPLHRVPIDEDCERAEPDDAASAMPMRATTIGAGGVVGSATGTAGANAAAAALATPGNYAAHTLVCSTLCPYEPNLTAETENAVTTYSILTDIEILFLTYLWLWIIIFQ